MLTIKEQQIARPLKILIPLIKQELSAGQAAAQAAGLEYYRRAGELLLEAKAQVAHGEWMGWVKRNFALGKSTAWSYMKLATESQKFSRPNFSTLSEVTSPSRDHHQPTWHEPVREAVRRVNVEALAKERQDREKEAKLTRQLALQLIDIGYKVLATKLHPDKGGSTEAMSRLNRVRDILKRAI